MFFHLVKIRRFSFYGRSRMRRFCFKAERDKLILILQAPPLSFKARKISFYGRNYHFKAILVRKALSLCFKTGMRKSYFNLSGFGVFL